MGETRIKARRYRIFQLSTHDCMTDYERVLYDKYVECTNDTDKKILRRLFEDTVKSFSGIRSILDERLYKKNKDGTLSEEYRKEIQNPLFEGEMARIANDFTEIFPLIKEIVYFECSLRDILQQIITNGLLIEGEKYIFHSATTNHMKKEMVILLNETFFKENEKQIMCGLSRDIINKGNERVKGCNRGKFLAYTSLPMSASVEVSSLNTDTEKYEIDIDDCIVVPDFEGFVHGKVNYLNMDTLQTETKEMDVPIPFMDGAGIFLPDGNVLPRTGQIRGGYFKGCLFPFDFVKFIRSRSDSNSKIKDIYDDDVDVLEQGIKVIFTGSQFKMWKYYKDWETFKKTFKECGCKIVLNNIAHTPSKNAEVFLTYQFLQTLPRDRFTDEAMQSLCSKTVKILTDSKTDINVALRIMGIEDDETNKELKPLQAALKLYPKLINDSAVEKMIRENINTMRKKAMGGKLVVDGFYSYICPDLYAFCEKLFCGIADPKGLIPSGSVYNAYYNDKGISEVDCLRSPHLGDSEHCIRTLVKTDACKEWFKGYDTVVSNHDLITKHLMCDMDGDEMLITSSQELISLVDRDKPVLYYEMEKADAEQITNDVLYECLISSFDNSIIGNISNALTKLYSVNGEPDYDFIRVLTAYNNWMIDYPKTQKAMDLKQYADKYQEWINPKKHKLPYYFIYAKGKSDTSVASYTDCNVDRVCRYIESVARKTRYKIFDADNPINPEILKDMDIEVVRTSKEYLELVKLLDKLHYDAKDVQRRTKRIKNKLTENKSIDENILKTDLHYYFCREVILNIFGDENIAASYLVDAEYHQPEFQSSNKKLIWNCFGNVVVENIKKNLNSSIPIRVRRDQYITKNSETHKNLTKAVQKVNQEMEEEEKVKIDITDKELEWIDNQQYRKNCQTDRLLLFILLYLQKRYGKDGCFKIKSNVKKGITASLIDDWIGSDICKKGISRLEKKHLITTESVVNRYGKYNIVHVNIPEWEEQNAVIFVEVGNPLIPLYEYTGERKVGKCKICGTKYVVYGNSKTCGKLLCKRKLEKDTKDKCNKKVI